MTDYEFSIINNSLQQLANKNIANFILINNDNFDKPKHLNPVLIELNHILDGAVSKMMFSVPPQHYKSVTLLNAIVSYFYYYILIHYLDNLYNLINLLKFLKNKKMKF